MSKYIIYNICCSHLLFIQWLQHHLLPCPFKFLTGIDCPGCGFQRSMIAMIQGNFRQSFLLYPAAVPILLTFAFFLGDRILKLDNPKHTVLKTMYLVTGSIILISYGFKIWHLANYGKVVSV